MNAARAPSLALVLAVSALASCTFEDGEHFAEVSPRLSVSYLVRADRIVDSGDRRGWQKLASGYELRLTKAVLSLAQPSGVQLLAAPAGGTGAGAFDPAHPPAGYSLCHNGHCHASDGRLVPYEEIAAAAGGSGQALAPLLTFPGGEPFDLLAEPLFRELPCPGETPGAPCALGRTEIRQVRLEVFTLELEGEVRDGQGPQPLPGGQLAFAVRLANEIAAGKPLATWQTSLHLPADNRHPPRVALDIAAGLGPEIFDDIPWGMQGAPVEGRLSFNNDSFTANAARKRLSENLQEAQLGGQVRRSGP